MEKGYYFKIWGQIKRYNSRKFKIYSWDHRIRHCAAFLQHHQKDEMGNVEVYLMAEEGGRFYGVYGAPNPLIR